MPEATIVDTGSTNTPGKRVTLDNTGESVTIEPREGPKQTTKVARKLCEQLMKDLQAAGPLDSLPATHCMKSASFGSKLYLEFNGVRSPDISCPEQSDQRTAALKKDAMDILDALRSQ